MNQVEAALKACDEIETLLSNAAPWPDTNRLQRVQFLAAKLQGSDAYTTRTAQQLAEQASIYFSQRKHEKQPGGAHGVMTKMRYSLLPALRREIQGRANGGA